MRAKLVLIPLLLIGSFLVTLQQNAMVLREAVQEQSTIPTMTVNINTASAQEIADVMVGVGLSKAKSIVEYREQHGKFAGIDQLQSVKGIGPATVEKNRNRVTF